MPALRTKRLHPHSMRHSTAVHLLRAGVDIVTISQWLGHASVTTTHGYATVDLDMKRQALAKARPTTRAAAGPARWRRDASVLERLEALRGRRSVMWSPRRSCPGTERRSPPRLHITDHSTLVDDEQCGPSVVPEPAFESACGLLAVEVEEQVGGGGGEESGVTGEDGLVGDVLGEHGFPEACRQEA